MTQDNTQSATYRYSDLMALATTIAREPGSTYDAMEAVHFNARQEGQAEAVDGFAMAMAYPVEGTPRTLIRNFMVKATELAHALRRLVPGEGPVADTWVVVTYVPDGNMVRIGTDGASITLAAFRHEDGFPELLAHIPNADPSTTHNITMSAKVLRQLADLADGCDGAEAIHLRVQASPYAPVLAKVIGPSAEQVIGKPLMLAVVMPMILSVDPNMALDIDADIEATQL